VGGTLYSGDFWGKILPLTALPLTVKSFNASVSNCNALLKWTTADETNTKNFQVENSADGINFTTLATVNAKSSNGAGNSYSKSFGFVPNLGYYRIKMQNINNSAEYSDIILLKDKTCTNTEMVQSVVSPNPVVNHELKMVVTSAKADNANVRVIDMNGKVVAEFNRSLGEGANKLTLPLPALASGQFIISVRTGSNGDSKQTVFIN
jgi:hypothetical protein